MTVGSRTDPIVSSLLERVAHNRRRCSSISCPGKSPAAVDALVHSQPDILRTWIVIYSLSVESYDVTSSHQEVQVLPLPLPRCMHSRRKVKY